jgi:hypothetical protein
MRIVLTLIVVAVVSVMLCACTSNQQSASDSWWGRGGAGDLQQVDGERIRLDLYQFADEASAEITGTATAIAREVPDRRTRELMLSWRIRSASSLNAVVLDPDPRRALVNTWMLIVQHRQFVTTGGGRELLSDEEHRRQSRDVVLRLEQRLEDVIRTYIPEDTFKEAEAEIERLAETTPIVVRSGSARLTLGSIAQAPKDGGIGEILALPLAPLTGLQGVSSTAQAIDRIAVVLSVITEIIEDIPPRVRWQTEALLLELEAGRSMEELRRTIARADEHILRTDERVEQLVDDVGRAIDLAETLPSELDRQREATLASFAEEREQLVAAVDQQRGHISELAQTEREAITATVDRLHREVNESLTDQREAILDGIDQQRGAVLSAIAAEREIIVRDAESVSMAVIDHAFQRLLILLGLLFVAGLILVVVARVRLRRA